MKHLCCSKIILFFAVCISTIFASLESKSAMVYYGDEIPYSLVGIHDYIILQPKHVNTNSHGFKLYSNDIYAYVSIGEIESEQSYYRKVDKKWVIGKNEIWNAKILDISNKNYHKFLFEEVIEPLHQQGFKNFFFDTLDSYHIASKNKEDKEQMRQGLIAFIYAFNKHYPTSKLIINRGFEIIDEVHSQIEAVLFESMFYGLSSKDLSYSKNTKDDREWLLTHINKIKSYNKPIIAVDYIPLENKELIQKDIQDIEALGLIPYIGDRDLQRIGQSSKVAMKREVLLLYDDTEFDGTKDDDSIYSSAFLQLSVPIEYLGYIPILKPISTWKPSLTDADRYAGAVIWINGTYATKYPKKFEQKMIELYNSDVKILFFETLLSDKHEKLLRLLQIDTQVNSEESKAKNKMKCNNAYMGFEVDPYTAPVYTYFSPKNATAICTTSIDKKKSTIAAITPWGGYAFDGAVKADINKQSLWIIDPFKIIKNALRLPSFPVPDVTTENGRRLLFVHVDGDGIMNIAEWNAELFSGKVLYDNILTQYQIPMSISIIEAETAKHGLYPEISQKLEEIAKDIFALDNVEAATHTYTHPFYWQEIRNDDLNSKFRLNVKNYDFSLNREINGSLAYINTRLTPNEKTTNMTFWSGDCLPTEETLSYMYQNDFLQINGGDTTIANSTPWLNNIAPLGLKRGDYYQVFTGAQNENVYTNDWLGPFWGYKRVIQTFKLTNDPRRLKPIDIYYHIYSASKRASLNALHTVYKWAIKQDVIPIYTSKYIPKVMDYYEVSIAKENNSWIFKGMDALNTIRLLDTQYIDFDTSKSTVGIKKYINNHYVHLAQNTKHLLKIVSTQKDQNYLIDANGVVKYFEKIERGQILRLKSEVPLEFRYHLAKGCHLDTQPKAEIIDEVANIITIKYEKHKDVNVTILCK